ncbi:MAG: hypothetical protein WC455_16630 [Dehalococcoidia bacterium]|jgi:hypothetical protein
MTIKELREKIEAKKCRSAWDRGVKNYALDLIEEWSEDREFYGSPADRKELLNGASSWEQYSEGGCALIYDEDIAGRTSNPSELKKTDNGRRNPNRRESWLDVQTRALFQAERLILRIAKRDQSTHHNAADEIYETL